MRHSVVQHPIPGFEDISAPIEAHHFDSGKAGTHLLLLSGVHAGKEMMPIAGLRNVVEQLKSGALSLLKGRITIIPVCNPKALETGGYWYHKNLNRVVSKDVETDFYEGAIAKHVLLPIIDTADALVDLHTTRSESPAYAFQEGDHISHDLAKACGAGRIIQGWLDLYKDHPNLFSGDTCTLVREKGLPAVTFECGHNPDPACVATAEMAAKQALRYFGLVDYAPLPEFQPAIIKASRIMRMPENARFTKKFVNFEAVSEGQPIMLDTVNDTICRVAPYDGVILLPKLDAEVGAECAYFGKIVQSFKPALSPYA